MIKNIYTDFAKKRIKVTLQQNENKQNCMALNFLLSLDTNNNYKNKIKINNKIKFLSSLTNVNV